MAVVALVWYSGFDTSALVKLSLRVADCHTTRKGCILDQLDCPERYCLRTRTLQECTHVEGPVLFPACKDSGRNRAGDNRRVDRLSTGCLQSGTGQCMDLAVAVGWVESVIERGSVGCCWLRMDQCYVDHTRHLVDGIWRNDLYENFEDAEATGSQGLYSQDVPRCWCPYWAPPTARYWELGCGVGWAGAGVGEE